MLNPIDPSIYFLKETLGTFRDHPEKEYFQKLYEKGSFRPQVVVCAANRDTRTNLIICGARHWDRLMHAQADATGLRDEGSKIRFEEQGFIDQYGNFLTRKEAKIIARKAGQIIAERDGGSSELFSEEIY